ncbi:glycosyltransferase family 87 protein [Roseibium sp.]|uniref:glycosyltransferase family 87 protein n=1 Tax=Roseibium sp. TaxID=1936156 RepID=UPI0039F10BD5
MRQARDAYLRILKSDELNNRFGGPVFVFILLAASLFLLASWYADDGGLFDFAETVKLAQNEDFAAFYRAGELARQGMAVEAYDYETFIKGLSESNRFLLFLNPPHSLLFYEPLTLMSYPLAKAVFLTICGACLFMTVAMARANLGFWPYFFVIASSGVFYSFQLAQLAPVTTFLLVFALLYSRTRPILSGLALSLLTIKPQYGLLVPVFLIACRDWRAFAVAAAGSTALVLASIGVYGWSVWETFLSSLTGGVHSTQYQEAHNIMITVGNSLAKLGAATEVRVVAQLCALPLLAAVVWIAARHWQREGAVALSLLAMSLAAPSFMFYDWLIYSAALLLLLKIRPTWPVSLQIVAGLLWIAPVTHDAIYRYDQTVAFYFSSFIPLLTLAVLALSFHFFWNDGTIEKTQDAGDERLKAR